MELKDGVTSWRPGTRKLNVGLGCSPLVIISKSDLRYAFYFCFFISLFGFSSPFFLYLIFRSELCCLSIALYILMVVVDGFGEGDGKGL